MWARGQTGGPDVTDPRPLRDLVADTWRARRDRYSEERAAQTRRDGSTPKRPRIEMYQIGG